MDKKYHVPYFNKKQLLVLANGSGMSGIKHLGTCLLSENHQLWGSNSNPASSHRSVVFYFLQNGSKNICSNDGFHTKKNGSS